MDETVEYPIQRRINGLNYYEYPTLKDAKEARKKIMKLGYSVTDITYSLITELYMFIF